MMGGNVSDPTLVLVESAVLIISGCLAGPTQTDTSSRALLMTRLVATSEDQAKEKRWQMMHRA